MVTPSVLALACATMSIHAVRASVGVVAVLVGSCAASCARPSSLSQRAPIFAHAVLQSEEPSLAVSDQIHRLPGGGGAEGGDGDEGGGDGDGGKGGGLGGGGCGASPGGWGGSEGGEGNEGGGVEGGGNGGAEGGVSSPHRQNRRNAAAPGV